MHCLTSVLVAAAVAAHGAVAGPIRSARSPYAVKETHFAPKGWTKVDRTRGEQLVSLQIGVKQGNFAELERHLYEVSDPSHARYGKHLSANEVNELVKPATESLDLVHEWLQANGIKDLSYSSAKDWIIVRLPVETVEKLLDTEYNDYRHHNGRLVSRTTRFSLPRHLHGHIDTIQPTTSFFHAAPQKASYWLTPDEPKVNFAPLAGSDIAQVCNASSVTPECFATLYSTKDYKPKAADKNKVGFTNYLGEIPIRPDTELFLKKYRPEAVDSAKNFKQYSIKDGPVQDGPLTPKQANDSISHEANLDVQAIAGISWPTPIDSYSTGGSPPYIPDKGQPDNTNEPYLDWVNWLLEQKDIPQVISTSYGEAEQTVPLSYAERVCQQFAQVGARGTSLLFSSGDSGVGGTFDCVSNDGKNTTKFLPAFPASCPYITSVGGTMNFQPEEAVLRPARNVSGQYRDFYAGGSGFSDIWPQPDYQKKVVQEYIQSIGNKHEGLYNKSGRGYPDIAAQSLYFAYFWNGTEGTISGTSASTPLSSGIIALLNDALIASGKPVLGFLNPWLYQKGYEGFTDITKGNSPGCGTDGFATSKGWDPVTGWGTPNFKKLVELIGCKF